MIMSSRICGGAQVDRQVVYDKKKKNTSRQKKRYLLGGYCFLIRIWPGFWVTMTSDCFCINCNLIGHVLMCWFTCEQPQLMKIRKPTRHWLLSKEHDISPTYFQPWLISYAPFAWLISRTFSANEYYFSLTINQPTVLSAMTYQPNEKVKLASKEQNTAMCVETALLRFSPPFVEQKSYCICIRQTKAQMIHPSWPVSAYANNADVGVTSVSF